MHHLCQSPPRNQASEAAVHEALAVYRPVAARAAVMFFVMDGLPALDRVYLFSMAAFVQVSKRRCGWRLGF